MRTATQIIEKLLNATGQFTKIKFQSIVKTSAAFKGLEILKITNTVVRSGIDFSNLKSVKEGIENGERNEVGSLPWGSWLNFPYIIGHNDKEYVRLYPSLSPNHKVKVSYFVNGIETPKVDIAKYLTNSEAKNLFEPKKVECFTLTNTNVLDISEISE